MSTATSERALEATPQPRRPFYTNFGFQITVGLVVGLILGLLAVAIGSLVGGNAPFRLAPGPIITTIGLLILFGMVGCLIAVRRITSVDPIVALRSQP